jgi:Uma2 family endonuclease
MSPTIANPGVAPKAVPGLATEILELFPGHGEWTEAEYLALPGNRLIELSEGSIEVLPMPTTFHQMILAFLYRQLETFVDARKLGFVFFSALPVRLWLGKMREPDIIFLASEHKDRIHKQYVELPDLVMEVVSENDPKRDTEIKRSEYAQAGIPEYWIVDPQSKQVLVLTLENGAYLSHGQFAVGQQAVSKLLSGFEVNVEQLFAAATL